jgi:hypothetical protein
MNVQIDVMLLVTSLISAFVFWEARSPKSRLKLSCVIVVPMKAESVAGQIHSTAGVISVFAGRTITVREHAH